ncbi:MAG: hypothetical protein AAB213_04870 [Candidatus Omnitrophota bacterium]
MSDLFLWIDRKARLKQVMKNTTDKKDVALTKKVLVFVPKIDSAEENESISPPPLPCWTRTIRIKRQHARTWTMMINVNI